jgi:hypothetical protein
LNETNKREIDTLSSNFERQFNDQDQQHKRVTSETVSKYEKLLKDQAD